MSTRFPATRTDGASVTGLPVAGVITSMFGARDIEEHASGHSGVDIAADLRTPVRAPADGIVQDVFSLAIAGAPWAQAWKRVFGNSLIVGHGDYVTLYAYLVEPPNVYEGQHVVAGDLLGGMGATGEATGPHLHWGMAPASNGYLQRDGLGGLVNPLDFVEATTGQRPIELDAVRAKLEEALALLQ